jgi:hypothetical protein
MIRIGSSAGEFPVGALFPPPRMALPRSCCQMVGREEHQVVYADENGTLT